MISTRDILSRRARLVERADRERDELAGLLAPWEQRLAVVDQGLAIFRTVKRYSGPLSIGVGAVLAGLAFFSPPSIMRWVVGGRAAWRIVRGVSGIR